MTLKCMGELLSFTSRTSLWFKSHPVHIVNTGSLGAPVLSLLGLRISKATYRIYKVSLIAHGSQV